MSVLVQGQCSDVLLLPGSGILAVAKTTMVNSGFWLPLGLSFISRLLLIDLTRRFSLIEGIPSSLVAVLHRGDHMVGVRVRPRD
ncbi:hypothetical protein BDW60DRAFT_177638 [Aspergillus nidulans var. acristatus]|jgi:hypothetical protein